MSRAASTTTAASSSSSPILENIPQSAASIKNVSEEIDLLDTCFVYETLPPVSKRGVLSSDSRPRPHQHVHATACGHVLQLSTLVRYLHGNPAWECVATMAAETSTTTNSSNTPRNPMASTTSTRTSSSITSGNPRNACPICQRPVLFICDQLCAVADSNFGGVETIETNITPTITFKYGKQTYRLAVVQEEFTKQFNSKITTGSTSSRSIIPWSSWWPSWLQGVFVAPTTSSPRVTTAQDRIIQALQLKPDSLKILYKGKVLYPDAHRSASSVSAMLMDLSNQDWNRSGKSSLIVMGTFVGENRIKSTTNSHRSALHISDYLEMGWDLCKMIALSALQVSQR